MTIPRPHETQSEPVADPGLMRAVVQDRYGSAPEDVLRMAVVDQPSIADDQVLVRVHAASVDRGTWHVMAGLPLPIRVAGFGVRRPKHLNPGRSLAGTVEAVGDRVPGFTPGDPVFGIGEGTFAEYAAARPSGPTRSWCGCTRPASTGAPGT